MGFSLGCNSGIYYILVGVGVIYLGNTISLYLKSSDLYQKKNNIDMLRIIKIEGTLILNA